MYARRLLPTIQELVAFESVARCSSFTGAAQELSLTQSAISKQIRQLEETLGLVLLERDKRRVVLTTAGRLYQVAVQETLSRLEASTRSVVMCRDSMNLLQLAVCPTFASRWLMPRLSTFLHTHPEAKVRVATSANTFEFEGSTFDIAIQYGTASWPNAEITPLLDEVVVPVASPRYRDRLGLSAPNDLKRATLIQSTTRTGVWSEWFRMIGDSSRQSQGELHFDQSSFAIEASLAGLGVALVPYAFVEEDVASGELSVLFDHPMRCVGSYYLVVPFAKRNAKLVNEFKTWLARELNLIDSERVLPHRAHAALGESTQV